MLFVCLGNICRSPLAEAAFHQEAEKAGLKIEIASTGTGNYHIGEPPDVRSICEAAKHGIESSDYQGRQLSVSDFIQFSHVFALDAANLRDIRRLQTRNSDAEIGLLMDVIKGNSGVEVADPYYGDADDFSITWRQVSEAARALVETLIRL